MSRQVLISLCVTTFLVILPCRAMDPPGSKRPPFAAEGELYSGGITGDSIGAAFQSVTRGSYSARLTFGFARFLHLSLDYMYSNQSRSFAAVSP